MTIPLKALTRRGLTPKGERERTPPILLAQWIGEHMMCVLRKVTIKRTAYVGGNLLRAFVTLDLLEIQEEARPTLKNGPERDISQGIYYDPKTGERQLRNSPLIVPATTTNRQPRSTGVPFLDAESEDSTRTRSPGTLYVPLGEDGRQPQTPRRSFYDMSNENSRKPTN